MGDAAANFQSQIVWCQLVGECLSMTTFHSHKAPIMQGLSNLMASRNMKVSKTAMVTLAHLQNKIQSKFYGLDTGSEDSLRTIHGYLRCLASTIEVAV